MKRILLAAICFLAIVVFVSPNAALAAEPAVGYAVPKLQVDIPGVDFDAPTDFTTDLGKKMSVNFLGAYVSGVYKYLIGFALTIAIVMIMIGGLQYVLGASSGDIKSGKKRMTDAIEGFVLLMFVFVILYTVNPETTLFKGLELTLVERVTQEFEDDFVNGTAPGNLGTPTASNVSGGQESQISEELIPSIDAAAATLASQGYGMSVTSALRTLETQLRLISDNCQNPAGSQTCNHKPSRPDTCILRGMSLASCPHTTGRALDVWGTELGSEAQCIGQDECLKDKTACRENPCQAAVLAAMKAEGFCNLASEPWHFEKPKMSSTCN